MTHSLMQTLPYGTNSVAKWALQPDGTVFVFVHGFGGNALTTWTEFDDLLTSQAKGTNADLLFFGYESTREEPRVSAIRLREMLNELCGDPCRFFNSTVDPEDHRAIFDVQRLIIVAHSLGAVVARQALADAARQGSAWINQATLTLFAPAHSGATLLQLAVILGRSTLGLALQAAINVRSPALRELQPGSSLLSALKQQTQSLVQSGKVTLAARLVALASNDRVVSHTDFILEDAPPEIISPSNHSTVCKPSTTYLQPMIALLAAL